MTDDDVHPILHGLSCSIPFYTTAGEIEHDIIYLGHFLEDENWDGQLLLNAMVIIVPFMYFLSGGYEGGVVIKYWIHVLYVHVHVHVC